MTSRATSFATYKDLVGYINCLLAGGTERGCYRKGDNGTGAWGDVTAQVHTPMVALPPGEIAAKWGTSTKGRGKKVTVKLSIGREFIAEVRDKAPAGVIDLNPAALIAAGLPQDTELSTRATWNWV
jgi:hypothetical protein